MITRRLGARAAFETFLKLKDKEYSLASFDGTLYDLEETRKEEVKEKNGKIEKKEYLRRQSRS